MEHNVRSNSESGDTLWLSFAEMRSAQARHSTPVRVIASDHREWGNLAVFQANGPNYCEIASAPPRNDLRVGFSG